MNREELKEIVSAISVARYGNEDEISLSKSLGIYTFSSMIENLYGYCCEDDVVNAITDAPYDRTLDVIFFDDNEDERIVCYLAQIKYVNEQSMSINYNEAATFVETCKNFPNLNLKVNDLVKEKIHQYKVYEAKEYEIEKKKLLITTGKVEDEIREYLTKNDIEVYDFDKLNSQIFIDEFLPDIQIIMKGMPIEYDENNLLGILDIGQMVKDIETVEYIDNQSLFAYNVRGKMPSKKKSIAKQIEETCMKTPQELFKKNNGITIVCRDFYNEENIFQLIKASVVNGQQTIRAIREIRNNLKEKSLFVSVKILRLTGSNEENKNRIIELAESANRQNTVKDSDLITNEEEQKLIYSEAKRLPKELEFIYKFKRDYSQVKKEQKNKIIITKEEATNYIFSFIYTNPNDRADDVMKTHYDKIFKYRSAKEIRIIQLIRNYIVDKHVNTSEVHKKAWQEKYDKFKKDRVINYCVYIFSLIISEYFAYDTAQKRKEKN